MGHNVFPFPNVVMFDVQLILHQVQFKQVNIQLIHSFFLLQFVQRSKSTIFGRASASTRNGASLLWSDPDSNRVRSSEIGPVGRSTSTANRSSLLSSFTDIRKISRKSTSHSQNYSTSVKGMERLRLDSNGKS